MLGDSVLNMVVTTTVAQSPSGQVSVRGAIGLRRPCLTPLRCVHWLVGIFYTKEPHYALQPALFAGRERSNRPKVLARAPQCPHLLPLCLGPLTPFFQTAPGVTDVSPTMAATALEAIVGAVYIDQGAYARDPPFLPPHAARCQASWRASTSSSASSCPACSSTVRRRTRRRGYGGRLHEEALFVACTFVHLLHAK